MAGMEEDVGSSSNSCSICGEPKFAGSTSAFCEDCQESKEKAASFLLRKGLKTADSEGKAEGSGGGKEKKKVHFKRFEPFNLSSVTEAMEASQGGHTLKALITSDNTDVAAASSGEVYGADEAWARIQQRSTDDSMLGTVNDDGDELGDFEEPRFNLSRTSSDAVWKVRRNEVLGASLGTPKASHGSSFRLHRAPSF